MKRRINQSEIYLLQADITGQEVDVIVNAANSSLMGGGGVDGAIHRAGGPAILEQCKRIREIEGMLAPGNAVLTGAGKLNCRFVVHTVGPIWRGGNASESAVLRSAYINSLALARDAGAVSIAFPSISTGAYGYPLNEAAAIAINAVSVFLSADISIKEVRFVLFDQRTLQSYESALAELPQP